MPAWVNAAERAAVLLLFGAEIKGCWQGDSNVEMGLMGGGLGAAVRASR